MFKNTIILFALSNPMDKAINKRKLLFKPLLLLLKPLKLTKFGTHDPKLVNFGT
jgi:hypothetical protein